MWWQQRREQKRCIWETGLTGYISGVEMGSRMREKEKSSTMLEFSVWATGWTVELIPGGED